MVFEYLITDIVECLMMIGKKKSSKTRSSKIDARSSLAIEE